MLVARGLHYGYGAAPVLNGVDLDAAAGEVVALVGPNGAGKSTLLKCVNGILTPSSGEVRVADRPVADYGRRELARAVSYVPQQAGQAMSLPVVEMVALGRAPHRGLGSAAVDRAASLAAIEQLGLQHLAFRRFGELSGGERQRVLIARGLVQGGRLVLLDEPTNNLDLRHQLEVMETVALMAEEQAMAVVVAIHDLSLAARFAHRLVMLKEGASYADGPWREVLTPANLQVVYGTSAIVGEDAGYPYVLPVAIKSQQQVSVQSLAK